VGREVPGRRRRHDGRVPEIDPFDGRGAAMIADVPISEYWVVGV
jgi:hypothetical protein